MAHSGRYRTLPRRPSLETRVVRLSSLIRWFSRSTDATMKIAAGSADMKQEYPTDTKGPWTTEWTPSHVSRRFALYKAVSLDSRLGHVAVALKGAVQIAQRGSVRWKVVDNAIGALFTTLRRNSPGRKNEKTKKKNRK